MRIRSIASGVAFALLSLSALPSHAALCSVGDKANVLWKGNWYPATVMKVNEDQSRCFIRYTGYGSNWDEWVGSDRFQKTGAAAPAASYKAGDAVQVKWKGTWYDASILKVAGGKYKIHYDQYDSSWDEWVGTDRIRPR